MKLSYQVDEKISAIKGFCLSSPYGDGNVFGQPKGVKSLGFIEVVSESGVSGFGETYAGIYAPELVGPIAEYLSHRIVGYKLDSLSFLDQLSAIPFIGFSGIIQSIISAIELAIIDLIGKLEQKPVYALFKYQDEREVSCYYSGGSVAFSVDDIANDIEKMKQLDFDAFKMRVGLQTWSQDLARVSTARSLLTSDSLMVDAIMGTHINKWTLDEAVMKINDLAGYDLAWIEEPLNPCSLPEYSQLCKLSPIPVAMGEAYSGEIHFTNIIENGYAHLVQVDATHSMGFRSLLDFSNTTVQNKATHVWGSALSFYANANLALLSNNIQIHEYPSVEFKISNEIAKERPKFHHGKLVVSDYPGFGIEINDEIKNQYRYIENSGYRALEAKTKGTLDKILA